MKLSVSRISITMDRIYKLFFFFHPISQNHNRTCLFLKAARKHGTSILTKPKETGTNIKKKPLEGDGLRKQRLGDKVSHVFMVARCPVRHCT